MEPIKVKGSYIQSKRKAWWRINTFHCFAILEMVTHDQEPEYYIAGIITLNDEYDDDIRIPLSGLHKNKDFAQERLDALITLLDYGTEKE